MNICITGRPSQPDQRHFRRSVAGILHSPVPGTGPCGTPSAAVHRAVVMATERGTLQHLIFDNRIMWHHRALATLLGAILALPPVKRAMATEQVKSRFLEALVRRLG